MRKDFYIFCHGQTDYNLEKRCQGCGIDSELNATGIAQAQTLIPILKPLGMEIIFTSALKRAHKTAEIVAEELSLPVKVIADLREGCFGDVEGMLKEDMVHSYPELAAAWYSPEDDLTVRFPNGESKQEMQQRMFTVLEGLLTTEYNIMGIASHGSSIRYLLMRFGFKIGKMLNTALFHIVYDNGNWSVEQL